MVIATVAMATLLGWAPADGPTELVARLGSPRFAERESAAESLRVLGDAALPALRKARLEQQGGFSLRVSEQGPERLIDAREPRPIPFWEAVDRLGLVCGHFDITNPGGGHFPTLEFNAGFAAGYPSTISGPFRITLEGLHDHRDRSLIFGPWLRDPSFIAGLCSCAMRSLPA